MRNKKVKKDDKYLVSYPTVARYNPIDGETSFLRTTIYIRLLEEDKVNPFNSVFAMGEALCGPDDNFSRKEGVALASKRAKYMPHLGHASSFTLDAAMKSADILANMAEDETTFPLGIVTTPLTGLPIPYGMMARLPNLLETNIKELLDNLAA
jgi:hypothetical protein